MKTATLALSLLALGCHISPVIADPIDYEDDRYSACRHASHDWCRHEASGRNVEECVDRKTYECVSGRHP